MTKRLKADYVVREVSDIESSGGDDYMGELDDKFFFWSLCMKMNVCKINLDQTTTIHKYWTGKG